MKIKEFVENVKKNPNAQNSIVAKVVNKTYIPVLQKRQLAEIVYNSSVSIENGIVKVDSLSKYLIFTMLMISEYTNLEFSTDENGVATEEAIQEFDMLCENGLINPIIACFEADYARSNEILNYVFKDNIAVNNNVEAVLGRIGNDVIDILDAFADVLANKVNELELNMPEFDLDQLSKLADILKGN